MIGLAKLLRTMQQLSCIIPAICYNKIKGNFVASLVAIALQKRAHTVMRFTALLSSR